MERKKRNRIAALLLAVTVLVITLYSALFVAAEADHDCVGEGCRSAIRSRLAKTH